LKEKPVGHCTAHPRWAVLTDRVSFCLGSRAKICFFHSLLLSHSVVSVRTSPEPFPAGNSGTTVVVDEVYQTNDFCGFPVFVILSERKQVEVLLRERSEPIQNRGTHRVPMGSPMGFGCPSFVNVTLCKERQ
ncbi:MAG: hypothetical protein IJY42_04685, partial [Clostridia bacterium]|nr:hypothetical protein [Clostridia bacterium]